MGPLAMPSGRDARTGAVASSSSPSASSRLSARRRLAPARPRPKRAPQPSSRRGRALGVTTRAASICGIDLGTTNSAVAIVVDGNSDAAGLADCECLNGDTCTLVAA